MLREELRNGWRGGVAIAVIGGATGVIGVALALLSRWVLRMMSGVRWGEGLSGPWPRGCIASACRGVSIQQYPC